MRSLRAVPTLLAALFVGAGGFVHLREWADVYREVPADVPGSSIVRVGFPVSAALSLLLAGALVATLVVGRRRATLVLGVAAAFIAASLGALVISRNGSLLGWMESGWSRGASQALAVEIGAGLLLVTALLAGVSWGGRARGPRGRPWPATPRAVR